MLGPGTDMHTPHTHTHTHTTLNISGKSPNQWVTSAPHRESTGNWSGIDRLLHYVQALFNKGLRIPTDSSQTSERGKTKETKETKDSDPTSRQEPSGEVRKGELKGGWQLQKLIPSRIPSANIAPEHPTGTHISLAPRVVTTRLTCSQMACGSGGSLVDKPCLTLLWPHGL